VRYASRISRLESRTSSCTARIASTIFERSVRGRGSSTRTSCMVSVDAPDTRRPCVTLSATARATAIGSTPPCRQKRLSSKRTSASTYAGSISSSGSASRHFSSGERNTCAGEPSRNSITVDGSAARRAGSGTAYETARTSAYVPRSTPPACKSRRRCCLRMSIALRIKPFDSLRSLRVRMTLAVLAQGEDDSRSARSG